MSASGAVIEVLDPGPFTTVQDLGRPGFAHLGVSPSGAADAASLRLGNRLVGNDESAAGLECVLGGLRLRFLRAATFAVTGAVGSIRSAGRAVDAFTAVSVTAGTELHLGLPTTGLRSYLAVRGGIDVAPVLGSRSTDTLGALGPAPVRAGDRLSVGDLGTGPVDGSVDGSIDGSMAIGTLTHARLRIVPGPRQAFFTDAALDRLVSTDWVVSGESNRIGIRLDGPELLRRPGLGELPSEPTRPGALQVPPHGRPILFGPDSPVTGGYPVIAVVHSTDRDRCGQLRPGQVLRFTI